MLDSSRTRARGLVLAVVCAAAVGLSACGDDDDDSDATSPTTTSESSELGTAEDGTTSETTETTETAETTTEDSGESGESEEAEGDARDVLFQQLKEAGIAEDEANCVLDELENSLGEERLDELRATEEPDQEVIEALAAAAEECVSQ